jgi:aminoglycoside phosphotransferase (APT) family kinase protein
MAMHADEVATDADLVARLVAEQFPRWAQLPIEPVASVGTDLALYRLGDDMVVWLPRIKGAVASVDKEHPRLPRLAPLLPVAIPVPLAKGAPAHGYPGWALSIALIQLPYYRDTNPALAASTRHVIREVLADHQGRGRR